MKRISIKGVLLGNLISLLAWLTLFFLVFFIVESHVKPDVTGMSFNHAAAATTAAMNASPWMNLIKRMPWIAAICASIFGGYVAARIAKHDELLNGSLSALFVVVGGGYYLVVRPDIAPLLTTLSSMFGNVGGGCLGGYLRLRVRRQKACH